MDKKEFAQSLIDYLYESPTPFQSVDCLKALMDKAGAIELSESEGWALKKNQLYYIIKDGTHIIGFKIGSKDLAANGFRIAAAHHDAPGFRIKPVASKTEGQYEQLNLEPYGGLIVHTWIDRPLAVAGRVCVRTETGIEARNININKPIMIIPSVAIHMDRTVNDGAKFNLQTEACPIYAITAPKQTHFMADLAEHLGVKAEDILSYELAPYEFEKGCIFGAHDEFISAGRTDDAAMAHASYSGFLQAADSDESCIVVAYDHEEIGSTSTRGARSNSLTALIDRICEKLGMSTEDKYRTLVNSMMLSADMAHAVHPAYAAKSDPNHPVELNKGPVLKTATYQSYATSSRGSALFSYLCTKNNIPYQVFANRSDARGGGTIGSGLAASFGMTTVDIGNPCLGMHSIREMVGVEDHYNMKELFAAFFAADLNGVFQGN